MTILARREPPSSPAPAGDTEWPDDLGSLFDRAREDDEEAIRTLRELERQMVLAVGARLAEQIHRLLDPMDVVQQVWLDMLKQRRKNPSRFNAIRSLRAVLLNAAKRKTWQEHRSHSVCAKRNVARVESMTYGKDGVLLERHFVAAGGSPFDAVLADDLFQAMLAKRKPVEAEILRLRRDGYLIEEIAARVGRHERTVRRVIETVRPVDLGN